LADASGDGVVADEPAQDRRPATASGAAGALGTGAKGTGSACPRP
jgi:hypothetical protein